MCGRFGEEAVSSEMELAFGRPLTARCDVDAGVGASCFTVLSASWPETSCDEDCGASAPDVAAVVRLRLGGMMDDGAGDIC